MDNCATNMQIHAWSLWILWISSGSVTIAQLTQINVRLCNAGCSVVFMDEPTSGLDARAAAIVMRSVKNISKSMRTVVSSLSGIG